VATVLVAVLVGVTPVTVEVAIGWAGDAPNCDRVIKKKITTIARQIAAIKIFFLLCFAIIFLPSNDIYRVLRAYNNTRVAANVGFDKVPTMFTISGSSFFISFNACIAE
jgi:hypothetical protein